MKLVPKADIRAAAGRVTGCGFGGTEITSELREVLREVRPGGLLISPAGIESAEQIFELIVELKSLHREPLLLVARLEGGPTDPWQRLSTPWPAVARLEQADGPSLSERLGAAMGRELRAMGFDVNLMPLLLADNDEEAWRLDEGAFGADPERVGELGAAFCRGQQNASVAACGKYFPAPAAADPKTAPATLLCLEHDLGHLRHVLWPPLVTAAGAGMSAMLTTPAIVAALDEDEPGFLSAKALAFLRRELAFGGVVLADAIASPALCERHTPQTIATLGLNAGCDLFLAPDLEATMGHYTAVIHSVEAEQVSHETLLTAAAKVTGWQQRFFHPPGPPDQLQDWVGCDEHRELAHRIENKAAR